MTLNRSAAETGDAYQYWAFISYSHKDFKWARRLHEQIETYVIPQEFSGRRAIPSARLAPARFYPTYLDRTDTRAASNLHRELWKVLSNSGYLIVICSPDASKSLYVKDEIEEFQRLHGEERIFAFIIDGEPTSGGNDGCFPSPIKDRQPLAADVRAHKDGPTNAKLKILAAMLGVSFDELKRRDDQRRIRRLQSIVGIVVTLLIAFAVLSWIAIQNRNRALAESQARSLLLSEAGRSNHALAEDFFRSDNYKFGLLHLGRALTYDPNNSAAAAHLWSAIVHHSANLSPPLVSFFTYPARDLKARQRTRITDFDDAIGYRSSARGGTIFVKFGGISDCAFSPRRDRIVLGHFQKCSAQVFDLQTGDSVADEIINSSEVIKVALSESAVAYAGFDRAVRVWRKADGVIELSPKLTSDVTALAFCADGTSIIAGDAAGAAILWRKYPSSGVVRIGGFSNQVMIAQDSKANRIVLADLDGNLCLFNDQGIPTSDRITLDKSVTDVQMCQDGRYVAVVQPGGTVGVLSIHEPASITIASHPSDVKAISFAPDGRVLATGCEDGHVRLWLVGTNLQLAQDINGGSKPVSLAFSGDGARLV